MIAASVSSLTHDSRYELHVLGLNLAAVSVETRARLTLSRRDAVRMQRALAGLAPSMEAVVIRARHHCEAFLVAPHGANAVRLWVRVLRHVRPDLLEQAHRPLHYYISGSRARVHLNAVAAGRYAPLEQRGAMPAGVKAALALAARCGTLGETLDGLFLNASEAVPTASPALAGS